MAASMLVLAAAGASVADIGPKPAMSFAFSFGGKRLTIAKGELLQCGDARCSHAAPLKRLGPQGFDCDAVRCAARAYGFARFGKLVITFSDGRTLASNVFSSPDFDAKFRVSVGAGGLTVQPQK